AFDPGKYVTFPADEDAIVPVTETLWFQDDAASRLAEFVRAFWAPEHLDENLRFIAANLGPVGGEPCVNTIRRYFATGFYKDHLRWYKRRPIYWLFCSGKQRAF